MATRSIHLEFVIDEVIVHVVINNDTKHVSIWKQNEDGIPLSSAEEITFDTFLRNLGVVI